MSKEVKDLVKESTEIIKDQVDEELSAAATGLAEEKEKVCAIYDGTKEAVVMIHKIAKDMDVCVLEGSEKFDKVKRAIKVEIPKVKTYTIKGIGEQGKDKTLEYIKACGEYCIKNGITKLYIPWAKISVDNMTQDLFMVGVPTTLGELSTFDKEGKEEKFVRGIFFFYATAQSDIEKNYKQYGIADPNV